MTISGWLMDFSLSELFQLIEQGQKTGLLTLSSLEPDRGTKAYIWVNSGRLVAAAHQFDDQGLVNLIHQAGWMSHNTAQKLARICQRGAPLGISLKDQGVLNPQQLNHLFWKQLDQEVFPLFNLTNGHFSLDTTSPMPLCQMTGLSIPMSEAIFLGLREQKDYRFLADKFPAPTSLLRRTSKSLSITLPLKKEEKLLWESTTQPLSLSTIAGKMNLLVSQTQQIAYRLIAVDLIEEVTTPSASISVPRVATTASRKTKVSKSFLSTLVGFLQSFT